MIVYNITQIAKTGLWQLFTKTVPIGKGEDPMEVAVKDLVRMKAIVWIEFEYPCTK